MDLSGSEEKVLEFLNGYNQGKKKQKNIKSIDRRSRIKEENKTSKIDILKLQKSYEAKYTPTHQGVKKVAGDLNDKRLVQKQASIPDSLKKALENYGNHNALSMSESFDKVLSKVQHGLIELTPEEMKKSELSAKQKNENLHLRIDVENYNFIKHLADFYQVTQDAVIICILNQELAENHEIDLSKKNVADAFNKVGEILLKQTYEKSLSCDLINLDSNLEKLELNKKISKLEQENIDKEKAIQEQQQIIQYLLMSGMGGKDDKSD